MGNEHDNMHSILNLVVAVRSQLMEAKLSFPFQWYPT